MAWSPYRYYLDKYIFLTFLLTGCNASVDSDAMAGIIAGAVIASTIFIAGISGIVYCIIRAQKSHQAKKEKVLKASNDLDYRTVVVRRIPTESRRHPPMPAMYQEPRQGYPRSFRGYPIAPEVYPPISQVYSVAPRNYPTVVGYSQYMVQYGSPMNGEGPDSRPIVSRMTTISHMPLQRPTLDGFSSYAKNRSSREKFADDLKSKRKKRRRSKTPSAHLASVEKSSDIEVEPLKGESRDIEDNSQFILMKKENDLPETKPVETPTPKANEPYALTSLFQRDPERPEPETENRTLQPEIESDQRASSSSRDNVPFSYLTQPAKEDTNKFIYPPKSTTPPKKRDQPETGERPVTPEYDVASLTGDEANESKEANELGVPAFEGNRFSYAATEELKQSSQFRAHYGIRESIKNPFGLDPKQVQFNNSSKISTRQLNPGSYANIPPAPPLP